MLFSLRLLFVNGAFSSLGQLNVSFLYSRKHLLRNSILLLTDRSEHVLSLAQVEQSVIMVAHLYLQERHVLQCHGQPVLVLVGLVFLAHLDALLEQLDQVWDAAVGFDSLVKG